MSATRRLRKALARVGSVGGSRTTSGLSSVGPPPRLMITQPLASLTIVGSPSVRGQELMSFLVRAHMSVAGQARSLQSTTSIRRLEPVLESIAGPVDRDDVAVVQQPVQDGRGQHVVAEHAAPFAERLVAGGQDRAAFIAAGGELEDHVGAVAGPPPVN